MKSKSITQSIQQRFNSLKSPKKKSNMGPAEFIKDVMDRIGFRAYYIYTSAQLLLESNNIHINTSKLTHSLNELQKLVQGIVRVMKNPSSLMDAFSQIMDKYDPNHQMKHSISRLHPHILKLQKRMKQTWKQVINRSMLGTSYNLVMIVQALISFVCAFILETMYLAFIFMRYVYKSVAFILFDKEGREDLWKGIVSLFKTLHDEFFEPAKGLFKTLIVCIEILAPSILSIFIAPYGLFVKFLTTILMLSGSVIKLSSQDTSDDIANNLLPFLFKLVLSLGIGVFTIWKPLWKFAELNGTKELAQMVTSKL